jgi:hypothetical protein
MKEKTVIKNNNIEMSFELSEGFITTADAMRQQAEANALCSLALLELAQNLQLKGVSAINITTK